MKTKKTQFIQTYSGVKFYPLEPDVDLILLPDIAHALSNQCRFSGHTRKFHSVAQHCVEVANLLHMESVDVQLAGLLHDATEAYLVDLPRPIKAFMPEYVKAEKLLMNAIAEKFNVPRQLFELVKEADHDALSIEALELMAPLGKGWDVTEKDIENVSGLYIGRLWAPEEAEKQYLDKFSQLWRKRQSGANS